jgi:hypothetical protein
VVGAALTPAASSPGSAAVSGRSGGDAAGGPGGTSPAHPEWMHRLAPGQRPPQFVLFSFDGVGSHEHWRRILPIAASVHAHFTGFLSGIYLLTDDQRRQYTGPGHPRGAASIGFGGSPGQVATRIGDLNAAIAAGHEIGTHYNGHFCHGAEPSIGRWSTAMWNAELDQFFGFVRGADAAGLHLDPATITGGRTPCLEGRWDQAVPAMRAHGFTYDSSRPASGVMWPAVREGVWEFWMPTVVVPAVHHATIMMDYNMWFALDHARDQPGRAAEFTKDALDTYRAAYQAAWRGNRAPLVVANHFNDWAGGAFASATEQFMAQVCGQPETVCATYSEVIDWMNLQDPNVLNVYRAMPAAQLR